MVIKRDIYLNQLIAGQQNGLIKIITGIRRCGKSFLLFELFRSYLLEHGIADNQIIEIALDDISNEHLREPHQLLDYIKQRIKGTGIYYVLLDEIQMTERFEEVLNSLLHIKNIDVYVTGSNSKFLSSDIITEFRGRGDEIHMYPLSFSEFYSALDVSKEEAWKEYCTYGGLPIIMSMDTDKKKSTYLQNLYESVYKADIIERHKIINQSEFSELVHVMASIIGSSCNPTKLSNTFKSTKNITISHKTINNYLSYMQNAFLLEKAIRFDIKGKKYINTLSKYYFSDIGIRNALLNFRQQEENHIMENIIYNELLIRGYQVDIGVVTHRTTDKNNNTIRKQYEVDFVVNQGNLRYYIQSSFAIPDKEKMEQESQSLLNVNDEFKKIIIVKDDIKAWYNEKGILIMGLMDFLLDKNSLR